MTRRIFRFRNRTCLAALSALALAVLAVAPMSALAGVRDGRSPDTRDAALAAQFDGRSPDTLDAAAYAHPYAPAATLVVNGMSPDTRDAAIAANAPLPVVDVMSPGIRARIAAQAPVPTAGTVGNGGLDWTDTGIGAAGGFVVALILAGALPAFRRDNRQTLAV